MSSRWKKGQSGNPKGRPRKSKPDALDVRKMLKDILSRPVGISQAGRSVQMTMLEASLLQLVTKAAAGNLRALRDVFQCAASVGVDLTGSVNAAGPLSDESKRLLDDFIASCSSPAAPVRQQASNDLLDDDVPRGDSADLEAR